MESVTFQIYLSEDFFSNNSSLYLKCNVHFRRLSKNQDFLKLLFLGKILFFLIFFTVSVFNLGTIQYSIFVLSMVYMVLKEFIKEEIFPFCKILAFNSVPVYTTQK